MKESAEAMVLANQYRVLRDTDMNTGQTDNERQKRSIFGSYSWSDFEEKLTKAQKLQETQNLKKYPWLKRYFNRLQKWPGINWMDVTVGDLQMPMYSGLLDHIGFLLKSHRAKMPSRQRRFVGGSDSEQQLSMSEKLKETQNIKRYPWLKKYFRKLRKWPGVNWMSVTPGDLNMPLYRGLMNHIHSMLRTNQVTTPKHQRQRRYVGLVSLREFEERLTQAQKLKETQNTKKYPWLKQYLKRLQAWPGVNWMNVTVDELKMPLYGGLLDQIYSILKSSEHKW